MAEYLGHGHPAEQPELEAAPPAGESAILGGFLSLSGGEIAARVVAFGAVAYLSRVLGADGFGILGFAAAVCGYLALSVSAGFGALGARQVARQPERAASLAGGVVLVRLALAVVAIGLSALLAGALGKPPVVRWAVVLTSLSFVGLALETGWVYKGLGRTGRVGGALVVGQVVYAAGVFLLVRGPEDLLKVPVCHVAGELAAAAFLGLPLLGSAGGRPDLKAGWKLLRGSGPITLSRLLRTLIYTSDIILLGFLVADAEVGVYTAAYRFCLLVLAVGLALHASYLPRVVRAAASGAARVAGVVGEGLSFALALALPMVAGGWLLARPLLAALFGAEYGAGAAALGWLLVSIACIYLHGVFHNVFLAFDRLRQETWIMAAGAVTNVSLNLLLIPRQGILGAAIATAVAEALILLLSAILALRLGAWRRLPAAGRVVVATLGMAAAVHFWADAGIWVLVPLGGLLYAGLLVALRAVPAGVRLRDPSR